MSGNWLQSIILAKKDNVSTYLNFEQWDFRFLQLAETVATWSKDPSTKVGSVIVDSKRRVIGLGYNGFPRGIQDLEERYNNRETKLKLVCHAERNALDNTPTSVEGSTLYATLFPCNECCKSIIQRGVTKVVTFVPAPEKRLLFNYDISYIMLREAGVELYQYSRSSYERWLNGDVVKGQSERQAAELSLQNQIHEAGWYGS
jgi:dCMP deaminase